MKRLALLLVCALTFVSCDVDDDGPSLAYGYAGITESDFPAFFEAGGSYDINVSYELPNACHTFAGFQFNQEDHDSKEYFLFAVTTYDLNIAECTEEDENLIEEGTIEDLTIDPSVEDGDVYTFHLFTGEDEAGENEYTTIEVPVGAPDDDDDNGGDDNNNA